MCAVKDETGNPPPNLYDVPIDLFKKTVTENKGSSFGLGRGNLQKVDHDRDIEYLRDNPSPTVYSPVHVGKVLSKDAIKFSMASKAHK